MSDSEPSDVCFSQPRCHLIADDDSEASELSTTTSSGCPDPDVFELFPKHIASATPMRAAAEDDIPIDDAERVYLFVSLSYCASTKGCPGGRTKEFGRCQDKSGNSDLFSGGPVW